MVTTTPQRCWLPIFTKGLLGVNLIHLGGRVATPWALRAPDLAGWIVQHYLRREYGNVVLNALASAWYSAAVSRTDFQLARTASTKSVDIVLSKFEGHQRKWWSAKLPKVYSASLPISPAPAPQQLQQTYRVSVSSPLPVRYLLRSPWFRFR
jgi:hypothetical protein